MRPVLLLSFFLGLPAVGFSQAMGSSEQITETARAYFNSLPTGFDIVSYDLRTSEVKGSPMLLSSWSLGEMVLSSSQKISNVPLKYDVYRQQLRVRRPQGDSIIVPVVQVKEFALITLTPTGTSLTRRFVRLASPELPTEINGGCAEVLTDGKHVQLVKFWRRSIVKVPENSTNLALSTSTKEFKTQEKYYLRWTGDGHMVSVRPKKNSLLDALAKQPAAQQALKAKHKSISSEADLAAGVATADEVVAN